MILGVYPVFIKRFIYSFSIKSKESVWLGIYFYKKEGLEWKGKYSNIYLILWLMLFP